MCAKSAVGGFGAICLNLVIKQLSPFGCKNTIVFWQDRQDRICFLKALFSLTWKGTDSFSRRLAHQFQFRNFLLDMKYLFHVNSAEVLTL